MFHSAIQKSFSIVLYLLVLAKIASEFWHRREWPLRKAERAVRGDPERAQRLEPREVRQRLEPMCVRTPS